MSDLLGKWTRAGRKRKPDVVGIEVGAGATPVVRVRRVGGTLTVTAADLLPPLALPADDGAAAAATRPEPLALARPLAAPYAAVAVSTPRTSVRLLAVPGGAEAVEQINFSEMLGLPGGADYRIGYDLLPSDGRNEQAVLVAGIPEVQARWAAALFSQGLPAPRSLQAGEVAALNCVARELAAHHEDACALAVDLRAEHGSVAAFHKGRLALLRQVPTGGRALVLALQGQLGVEEELVAEFIESGAVDATQIIARALEPLLRQLMLAREFVERKRLCKVERILFGGLPFGVRPWEAQIEKVMGIRPLVWNPLALLPAAAEALAPRAAGQEARFAAALGAALAVMEADGDVPH